MIFFQSICEGYRQSDMNVNSQSNIILGHSYVMRTMGERVRETREERGYTQKKLAELSGLSQTTISDIERGRNSQSRSAVKIAAALKVQPLWLTTEKGVKEISTHLSEGLSKDALEIAILWQGLPEPERRHYRNLLIRDAYIATKVPHLRLANIESSLRLAHEDITND